MNPLVLSPTDFVAVLNQTLEFAYPSVTIEGELSNFRVSKGRWVYFDLKDDYASVKFFGTVYNLPGPLEEGMMLKVTGMPRLHPAYGFSVNVQSIELSGEGTIKKAFDLLLQKLTKEGLFEQSRKRPIPYPPARIGLITSGESAAYADFVKVLGARWKGCEVLLADVQVQGDPASGQITRAIEWFNTQAELADVLVVIRGGGSADDLQAFSTEAVTRAVAASRIPTLVAIGHEVDLSLAELAADVRASTPSNAAELLVPDYKNWLKDYQQQLRLAGQNLQGTITDLASNLSAVKKSLYQAYLWQLKQLNQSLAEKRRLLYSLSPQAILSRGYAIALSNGKVIKEASETKNNDIIEVLLHHGSLRAKITSTKPSKEEHE